MTIFGRQPVAWVGIIAAFVIAIIQTANGQGLISDAIAGRVIDLTNSLEPVALILVPLVMAAFLHPAVTPVVAPALPAGTTVTVLTPPGQPDTTTVLPTPAAPLTVTTTPADTTNTIPSPPPGG